jgi:hypothetical protein
MTRGRAACPLEHWQAVLAVALLVGCAAEADSSMQTGCRRDGRRDRSIAPVAGPAIAWMSENFSSRPLPSRRGGQKRF